jgi:hypothetical protein
MTTGWTGGLEVGQRVAYFMNEDLQGTITEINPEHVLVLWDGNGRDIAMDAKELSRVVKWPEVPNGMCTAAEHPSDECNGFHLRMP